MTTLEKALAKRYPLPGEDPDPKPDPNFVKVGLSWDCDSDLISFENLEEFPDREKWCSKLFEIPREWLDRWNGIASAYGELQDELDKLYMLPRRERWLTAPKGIIQGKVIDADES